VRESLREGRSIEPKETWSFRTFLKLPPFSLSLPCIMQQPPAQQGRDHQSALVWAAVCSLVPGAVHGATTVLFGHPLDTAKTRRQTGGGATGTSSSNLPRALREIVRSEGVAGLYRGVTPPIVMMCTKRSLQFAMFDSLFSPQSSSASASSSRKNAVPQGGTDIHGGGGGGYTLEEDVGIVASIRQRLANSAFMSGALAGVSGTSLGCPMHVVKIQTQNTTRDVTANARACAVKILRAEGVRGFYRGLPYHLLKDGCFASMYLGTYKWIMSCLAIASKNDTDITNAAQHTPGGSLKKKGSGVASFQHAWWAPIVGGSVASMLTWAMLYPLDTVKTVVQARQVGSFRELLTSASLSVARGGLAASVLSVYRGVGVALARAGPVSGLAMFAYETTKTAMGP
jgi:hypothetical protein